MNRTQKLILIFVSSILYGNLFGTKTAFTARSQSVNSVRELVGWQTQINKADSCNIKKTNKNKKEEGAVSQQTQNKQGCCYGTAALTVEYNRSFNVKKIRKFLFDTDCALIFSGSKVFDRGENDILADYFGLPFGFKSKVIFKPRISNFIFDLDWYQSLDCVCEGLYFRIHAPIVHTKWDLHMCEQVLQDNVGTYTFYPAGYMGSEKIVRADMNASVMDAFKGLKSVGDLEPLHYGKIWGRQTASHISDVQVALGYNFLLDEDYHLGLAIRTAIPTGNKPDAEFLFEPIVGNGHHWELGGTLSGHYTFWRPENEEDGLSIYLDANITHLFKDTQKRSYDLKCGGSNSRYMLLQEMNCTSTNLRNGNNGSVAESQYIGRLLPAINVTTLDTQISIGVQADIVLKLAYQHKGFEFDFGYNFYGRSKEKIKKCGSLTCNKFAIKGDAQVYGFNAGQEAVPLNATESKATIHKGQGVTNFDSPNEFDNLNIDNLIGAFDGNNMFLRALNNADGAALKRIVDELAHTSDPAVLLTDCDLDIDSATLPKAITHKLFINFSNVWIDAENIVPYIGGGLSTEWACRCFKKNSGYSQWALWVKGGLSY